MTTRAATSPPQPELPDWATAGPQQVANGVYRIPLPLPLDGLRAVNVYAILGDHALTCIDGGWAVTESRQALDRALKEIGCSVRDIDQFLVTHVHRDHYTQAIQIREEFGRANVALGVGDRHSLELFHGEPIDEDPTAVRLRLAGAPEEASRWPSYFQDGRPVTGLAVWSMPDRWLTGDLELSVGSRTISAIRTPGHTRGHYVFVDREAGLLFSGDHVLPGITPSVGFESAYATNPLHDYLDSLARMLTLPNLQLLPAHGAAQCDSHPRVRELLSHHEHRLAQCIAAVGGAAKCSREVAAELRWTRHSRELASMDTMNAGLAILETMAHLDLLTSTGHLVRHVENGVAHYAALRDGPV